jgi:hypothetical protein
VLPIKNQSLQNKLLGLLASIVKVTLFIFPVESLFTLYVNVIYSKHVPSVKVDV